MSSKITALIIIILCAGMLNSMAQDKSINVFVQDANTNDPIESALVSLVWEGMVLDSVYTDINGRANINISITSVREPEGLPSSISLSNNYPNPFNENTNVELSVPEAQTVTASIYNVLGQRVASENISVSSGYYTLNLSLSNLPKGVYFLRVGGRESQVVKLTKMGSEIRHSGSLFSISPSNLTDGGMIGKIAENEYILRAKKDEYDEFETSITIPGSSEIVIPLVHSNNGMSGETVTDIDGNDYPTVSMGMEDEYGNVTYRYWMAKNLRVTHYRNGDPIPTSADNSGWANLVSNQQGAWTVYGQGDFNSNPNSLMDVEKLEYYGALYTWWAVEEDINGRGLCPEGWRIPTDDEWTQLERYLGTPEEELSGMGNRGRAQLVAARLKSTRTGVISAKWEGSPFPDPGSPTGHFRNNAPGADGEIGNHPFWYYPNVGANPNFDNPEHPSYVPVIYADYLGAENDYDWFDNQNDLNPLDLDQFEEGGYVWNRTDMRILGTISSASDNTITDNSAPFGESGSKVPWRIHIRSGSGAGQWRTVVGNTSTTLTLDEPWDTMPSPGDEYNMYSSFYIHAQPSFATGENFVGNETGFNLIPSGMRNAVGVYGYAQRGAYLWTSTRGYPRDWNDPDRAMVRVFVSYDLRPTWTTGADPKHSYNTLRYTGLGVLRSYRDRDNAYTIRCLKD